MTRPATNLVTLSTMGSASQQPSWVTTTVPDDRASSKVALWLLVACGSVYSEPYYTYKQQKQVLFVTLVVPAMATMVETPNPHHNPTLEGRYARSLAIICMIDG